MTRTQTLMFAALIAVPTLISADQPPVPALAAVATYDTGLGGSGAEIISVRHTDGIAVLTNIAGSVDVLRSVRPAEPAAGQSRARGYDRRIASTEVWMRAPAVL